MSENNKFGLQLIRLEGIERKNSEMDALIQSLRKENV